MDVLFFCLFLGWECQLNLNLGRALLALVFAAFVVLLANVSPGPPRGGVSSRYKHAAGAVRWRWACLVPREVIAAAS